jgi:hypothetical protein
MAWLLAQRRRRVPSLQSRPRIFNRGRARTGEGNGRVRGDSRRRRLAGDLHDRDGRAVVAQRPTARSIGASTLARAEKFVAILWGCFRREAVPGNIFGDDARHNELQKIIGAACFGAAAAHFETAEWMAADNRAGA